MKFYPQQDKRVLFMGPNGSGKTELARVWLEPYNRVIIVDLKEDWTPSAPYKIIDNPRQLNSKILKKYQHIIYRPTFGVLVNNDAKNIRECDQMPARCMDLGNCTLYYDDIAFIASDTAYITRIPNYFLAETTGRGLGVGVWKSTQRPFRIPIATLSESDRRVAFYLRTFEDRKRAKELVSEHIPWNSLKKHQYSFYMGEDRYEYGPTKLHFTDEEKTA